MSPDVARAIVAYAKTRDARRDAMLATLLPEQRQAIEDPVRLKALFCPRRSGKSWCIGVYLFLTALMHPGSSCLYLGLTKDTATGIMNKDIFRVVNERFQLAATWNASERRWTLPNGSVIYLRGADANAYEISKVVGQKYRLAVLDEASKYRYVVRTMVYGALLPAMGDDLGTVVLAGTPSNICTGLFFDATTGKEAGWSCHAWTWRDNRFKLANIQRAHDEMVAANPSIVTTPLYRQEWLGEWVVDAGALVYRYREDLNTIAALPHPAQEYTYLLGLDLGYTDPTAAVVVAYHEHDPTLYVVHAAKHAGMIISDVAEMVRGYARRWNLRAMVADAAALQGVEEMRQRHGLPIEAADKAGKRGVIEVMNSDLATGRVKLLPEAMSLPEEWGALIWNEKQLAAIPPRWEEDSRFANHLTDAALYAWRKARNYDARPAPPPPPDPNSQAWADADILRELESRATMQESSGWPRGIQVDRTFGGRR